MALQRSSQCLLRSCFLSRNTNIISSSVLTSYHAPQPKRTILHTAVAQQRRSDGPPPDYPPALLRLIPKGPSDEAHFGSLVYVGLLNRQVLTAKYISLTSSAFGLAAQPAIFQSIERVPLMVAMVLSVFGGFFIYITPFLLHIMVRKYVLRMYYDRQSGKFTAVTLRFIPWRKFTTFTPNDVYLPKLTSALAVISVRQENKKDVPLFINPPEFMDQDAYGKLMGYDKPIVLNQPEGEER